LWALGLFSPATPIPRLILVPSAHPLPNGDTGYEVDQKTIQDYLNVPNAQSIDFWISCNKYGYPKDWRQMTPQQKRVLDLFDQLNVLRKKE